MVCFIVSGYWLLRGAWIVLTFSLIELFAVGVAFLIYARHATDFERIVLKDGQLTIDIASSDSLHSFNLDPRITKVRWPSAKGKLIQLVEPAAEVKVGRYLSEYKRRAFAQELIRELRKSALEQVNINLGF